MTGKVVARSASTALALSAALGLGVALAQQVPSTAVEEVVVVGTHVAAPSQFDSVSPVFSITRNDFDAAANEISDIVDHLTINTGSQNRVDAFTQNFSTGTSNLNLRGIGVGSTLVLINGLRQTPSAVTTDRGESFVDTSSLPPLIAIERIEVLKDGATALYGSDAVAGVVNFRTRRRFEGIDLRADLHATDDYSQRDRRISALYGHASGAVHILGALSRFERNALGTDERRLSTRNDDLSQAGYPGSFLVPRLPSNPAFAGVWSALFDGNGNSVADAVESQLGLPSVPGARLPVFADQDCTAIAHEHPDVVPALALSQPTPGGPVPVGLCQFDFGRFFSIVPSEERVSAYLEFEHDFPEGLQLGLEWHAASNEAVRDNSPSYPFSGFPRVAATHPDNPYGVDVFFIGRVRGVGADPVESHHDSDTARMAARVSADLGEKWEGRLSVTSSENDFFVATEDVLVDRFEAAIKGFGGRRCEIGAVAPGAGGCAYFNPFGTAFTGTGTSNSADLLDSLFGDFRYESSIGLESIEAVSSGQLGARDGGRVSVAVGAQWRREEIAYQYDANVNSGNFAFFGEMADFAGKREVRSVFADVLVPVADSVNLQIAARHENYDGDWSSTNPKLGLSWNAYSPLTVRASIGTSFRAPSLFQQLGAQTSLVELVDPSVGSPQFYPVRTIPGVGGALKPERALVTNIGLTWQIGDRLMLSLDRWSLDYDAVIVQENPQAILARAATGDPTTQSKVRRDPLSGLLLDVETRFVNASKLATDGFDVSMEFEFDSTREWMLRFGGDATILTSYGLNDPQVGIVDGLGMRNFSNFATSAPQKRANVFATWIRAQCTANLYLRYIDSYRDDQDGLAPATSIDSHMAVDARFTYDFDVPRGFGLSLGALNLLDEDPPYVATNGGYDSKVHNPLGRVVYVQASMRF